MPQPYLLLFDRLPHALPQALDRAESVLASFGVVFSGLVQKFEPGKNGALFYRPESLRAATLSAGARQATKKKWPGVSFECRYLNKDLTLGFFADGSWTVMTLDEDTVLFYDREKDLKLYEAWNAMVLSLMKAVDAKIGVYQRGGDKEAVDLSAVIDQLKVGALLRYQSPIYVAAASTLFSYDEGAVFDLDAWRVDSNTLGYTTVTWLHP